MQFNLLIKFGVIGLIFCLPILIGSGLKLNQIFAESNEPQLQITEFKTDKNTYSSYEEMKISLKLKSSEDLENVTIVVWGIKPRNYAYVNVSKNVDLKKGENEFFISAKTPRCTSGCGGVYPGPYELNAEVWFNGKALANSNLRINLVSN